MRLWHLIVGAVAGLLALLGLRRSTPPPAPPDGEAHRIREQGGREAEELRQRHAAEQARLEEQRQQRDHEIRQAAEKEQRRDAVDRANDELDAMGWRPPGAGGGPSRGG
ncbi:hypothetical protein [Vulgatibacter sp.]|uniref:hypothetical protein n=1 Tax=Vulgatibacter sp. TaxID=1971226 RepID=UPI003563A42F